MYLGVHTESPTGLLPGKHLRCELPQHAHFLGPGDVYWFPRWFQHAPMLGGSVTAIALTSVYCDALKRHHGRKIVPAFFG